MVEEVINSFITDPSKYFIVFWNINNKIDTYLIEVLDSSRERRVETSLNISISKYLSWVNRTHKISDYFTHFQSPEFLTTPACKNFYRYVVQTDDKIPYNYYPFGQIFYFSDKILVRVGENLNNTDNEILLELFRWFPISKSYNDQEITLRRDSQLNITGDIKVIATY